MPDPTPTEDAEPVGTCDGCGAYTSADSFRSWACDTTCYNQLMGIEFPGY